MNYQPRRYTTLLYQIQHPSTAIKGMDLGDVAFRGQIYQERERKLEAILRRHKLSPNSSEGQVRRAALNALTDRTDRQNGYRDAAIIELVFDVIED